jgi:hypothetical protein
MGLGLIDYHPIHTVRLFQRPGMNAAFWVRMPALPGLSLVLSGLSTNELPGG